MNLNVVIEQLSATPVEAQNLEIVERKGQGHPDYLIDSCSEAVSLALSKYYVEHFGRILHHNVDKGLLVGGSAKPRFGGGEVIEPINITVAGRATIYIGDETLPMEEIVPNAIKNCLRKLLRFLDPEVHVRIEYRIRPGSVDLVEVFRSGEEVPLANDTSVGMAFAPLTPTELLTYKLERYLNSEGFKRSYPMVGEDIKVMSLRLRDSIRVTVAMPIIDRFVRDPEEYFSIKEEVREKLLDYIATLGIRKEVSLEINTADSRGKGIYYLTVTGTSAESGDDGNTGRGNRISGLITPNRPVSMEAVAGKNPVSHVGKVYNVLAKIISERIVEELAEVKEVYVKLLSAIGRPITNPQVVGIQVVPKTKSAMGTIASRVRSIVEEEFAPERFKELTKMILEEKAPLF